MFLRLEYGAWRLLWPSLEYGRLYGQVTKVGLTRNSRIRVGRNAVKVLLVIMGFYGSDAERL